MSEKAVGLVAETANSEADGGNENETQAQQFVGKSKRILEPYLKEYGLVLYSNKSTLRRNPVLFYGFNPGYDPSREHAIRWTIGESLDYFSNGFSALEKEASGDSNKLLASERLHEDCNLIDDQRWPYRSFSRNHERGRERYQRNTRNLLTEIGCRDPLITNLLFLQTTRPEDMRQQLGEDKRKQFEAACWCVHELIFQITELRVLIACGSAVNGGFIGRFKLELVSEKKSGYGQGTREWMCKHWAGAWEDMENRKRNIVVCQIPHMTYYNVAADYSRKREVAEWARGVVQAGTKD